MTLNDWPPRRLDRPDTVEVTTSLLVPDTGRPDGITPDEQELQTEPWPTEKSYFQPAVSENSYQKCGTCKYFIEGGACALVKGRIDPVVGICKFYKAGETLPWNTPAFPVYEQSEAGYVESPYEPYLAMQEAAVAIWDEEQHPRDPDGKFAPKGQGTVGSWDKTEQKYRNYLDRSTARGFTFDPAGNTAYDFESVEDNLRFFNKFSVGGQPVYVIGVTNQIGKYPTRQLQSEYDRLQGQGNYPFVGYWHDQVSDKYYTDISYPASGIDEEFAKKLGKHYAQVSIVRLDPDGTFNIIPTGASLQESVGNMSCMARYVEAVWNEEDHPRDEYGRFVSKYAIPESELDIAPEYKSLKGKRVTKHTPEDEKKEIVAKLKQELFYKHGSNDRFIGRNIQDLTDQNYIDFYNARVQLYEKLENIEREFEYRLDWVHQTKKLSSELLAKKDALDPSGFYSNEINAAMQYAETYFPNKLRSTAIKNHMATYSPEVIESLGAEKFDQLVDIAVKRRRLQEDELPKLQQMSDEMEEYRVMTEDIKRDMRNHRISSLPHNFFVDDEALKSDIIHQVTAQLQAIQDKWELGGRTPRLDIEINGGPSEKLFKVGGQVFRRGASWNSRTSRVVLYNTTYNDPFARPETEADYKWHVGKTMAHELAHAQWDMLRNTPDTLPALQDFYSEADKFIRRKASSEQLGGYFARYATARRSGKRGKDPLTSYARNMETELYAALSEHQMNKRIGGKPFDKPEFTTKYERLKREYPKLIKAFETLRGMEGPQFEH